MHWSYHNSTYWEYNTQLHSQKTGPLVVETGTVAVTGDGGGCDVSGSSGMVIMLMNIILQGELEQAIIENMHN